jgi:hypothetical protein
VAGYRRFCAELAVPSPGFLLHLRAPVGGPIMPRTCLTPNGFGYRPCWELGTSLGVGFAHQTLALLYIRPFDVDRSCSLVLISGHAVVAV